MCTVGTELRHGGHRRKYVNVSVNNAGVRNILLSAASHIISIYHVSSRSNRGGIMASVIHITHALSGRPLPVNVNVPKRIGYTAKRIHGIIGLNVRALRLNRHVDRVVRTPIRIRGSIGTTTIKTTRFIRRISNGTAIMFLGFNAKLTTKLIHNKRTRRKCDKSVNRVKRLPVSPGKFRYPYKRHKYLRAITSNKTITGL